MTYAQPMLLAFLLLAFIGLSRRTKRSELLLRTGLVGLALLSSPLTEYVLSRPLEIWYPARFVAPDAAEAIVVLAASVNPAESYRPYPVPGLETYRRCEFSAWLHKSWRPLPVLACGGPGEGMETPFAVVMKRVIGNAGVPESMIWTEETSRSTYENARGGAEILRRHGIGTVALVVDARDMLRAAACFRKQGIKVVPVPCDFRKTGSFADEMMPSWRAIRGNEATLHEVLGLAWYWWKDRI
ncbi:MAG: YdcF family protein [Bryobacteraceae bacterium]